MSNTSSQILPEVALTDNAGAIASADKVLVTAPAPAFLLAFKIPDHDQPEFQRLPDDVRADVERLLIEFREVHAAKKINPALESVAGRLGAKRGFNFSTLRTKFYKYRAGGDWRVLVDKARCSKAVRGDDERDVNLPADFIKYLKGLFQSNKRKSLPAVRKLYQLWRDGESIPGYGTWQEWFLTEHPFHPLPQHCPPDMPKGWSKGNLMRYIPEQAELALARRGISEARNHLPDVLTTREGLRPLECVMFDDVRTDFKILVQGYESPVELNLLVAMDVSTGMILRFGFRPAITRDDGVKDKLKLHDMKCLVAGLLMKFGVPKNYAMTFVVENATAALNEGTALALRELSTQQIAVSRTMMINGTALFGGYRDKAMGNPRGKAPLESTFNLLHNEAAFERGQIGRRYDEGPAELQGRTEEAKVLHKVSRHLTPHERAALKMPFLNVDQARIVLTDIFNRIIRRTDHAMEGFQLIGEWRNEKFQQWRHERELVQLSPEERELVQWRNPARKESPLERWSRLVEEVGGANAFQKLHPGAIMRLYDEHKKVEIAQSEIVFKFQKETFVYRIANVQGARQPLQNEMQVLAYFDPQDMAFVHLTDGKGGYLGSIPRTRGARRFDKEAIKEQFMQQREALHKLQATVSDRMPHVAEEHLAELTHNVEVLANAEPGQIEIAPENGGSTAPSPEFASQIQTVITTEKAQRKTAATREKALKHFKGDVADLAEVIDDGRHETPVSEDNGMAELVEAPKSNAAPIGDDYSAEGLL